MKSTESTPIYDDVAASNVEALAANNYIENIKKVILSNSIIAEGVDRETSIRIATLFFLVYVYNHAGFFFLLITLYRAYIVFKDVTSLKKLKMVSDGDGSSDHHSQPIPVVIVQNIISDVLIRFFNLSK